MIKYIFKDNTVFGTKDYNKALKNLIIKQFITNKQKKIICYCFRVFLLADSPIEQTL